MKLNQHAGSEVKTIVIKILDLIANNIITLADWYHQLAETASVDKVIVAP
jgi:hypothetical protein